MSSRITDVDVVSDLMVHDIDIVLDLVGGAVTDVTARLAMQGKRPGQDFATALLCSTTGRWPR